MKDKAIKLKFTDIEFSILADLVFAGDWVINSWRMGGNRIYPYKQMQERFEAIVAMTPQAKKFILAGGDIQEYYEFRVDAYLKQFSESSFFETLAEKLSRTHHPAGSRTASEAFEQNLIDFQKNGLKNLELCNKKKSD